MRIVVTGGGSGGHITPILAVAHELKLLEPDVEIVYIGERGDTLSDIPAADPNISQMHTVWAGKLRRYSDEGWKQWLNVHEQRLNVRDVSRLARGVAQSYSLIKKLKPDVIFTRGGFVSVPVAVGGYLNHVPYITHDSDSVPSLANRLIAPRAAIHAVALPADLYPYPENKTITVGVPVSKSYVAVTATMKHQYRQELGLNDDQQVIFLTGGGNGSRVLNEGMVSNARHLLGTYPNLVIVHVAGRAHEVDTNRAYDALGLGAARSRVQVLGFISGMVRYSGAADVVITRGGATTLAEYAVQGSCCLIVPSKQLGWNVKNAELLAKHSAALVLTEAQMDQPERLGRTLGELLSNSVKRSQLSLKLSKYAHPQAAAELAKLVLEVGNDSRRRRVR